MRHWTVEWIGRQTDRQTDTSSYAFVVYTIFKEPMIMDTALLKIKM